ncbi:MAG TPA: site-specific integrase [Nocardioides sp.]|uniref:tyrosine-type recombinase/integrase n=1 Tax=Nocardioides sp. TaxID=35761 RepID=UPI002E2EEE7A|nr:site-specific integrase [Nocardioides sp.]HEX5088939.1 site-specific integrase [Nocardioides sp.]
MATPRSTRSTPRKPTRTSFGNVRRLPSGRWQARFTDSREERHTAPVTFVSKREAEDYLATVRADMVRGAWRAPELGAVTLADYSASLLAVRVDLAPKTRQLYDELARLWINATHELPPGRGGAVRTINLGEMELGLLTVAVIREWYAAAIRTTDMRAATRATESQRRQREKVHAARSWALDQGLRVGTTGRLPAAVLRDWEAAGCPGPGPAPTVARPAAGANPPGRARVAQAYRYLKTVLQQAVRDGRIDANPCQIPSAGLIRTPERVPATPEQVDALAAAMPPRWAAAVQVAAWSGLRAGELFGLARRHVDLEAGTLRVERAVTYLPGEPPFLGTTKTESSRRTVHLPPHVVALLAEHMEHFTGKGPDALVFADEGGRIAPANLRQRGFRRARNQIGRPELTWHDLRHTGATIAAQAGASLRELQHRLGHSTVRAAMIYQHADAQRDRELAQTMSQLAAGLPGDVVALRSRESSA